MPDTGSAFRSSLSDDERDEVSRRLRNLTNDPIRFDFGDPDLFAFTDRQRSRLTDRHGIPTAKDFEPFEPSVKRSDAWLDSPVGEDQPNHPLAVFNTKKLLNTAGFHNFKPGIEPMGEATPRFAADLGRFQTAHDLKPDRTAHPGGPTLHMLTRKAFGTSDGPLPATESALFHQRFGKDPNRTLSGAPIFGLPQSDVTADSASDTQLAARRGRRRRPRGSVPEVKRSRIKKAKDKIERKIDETNERGLEASRTRRKRAKEETRPGSKAETPVTIFRYPDGRLYVSVDERGKILGRPRESGRIRREDLVTKAHVDSLRSVTKTRYPELSDKRSFEERRDKDEEEYVYGSIKDKTGFVRRWTPLIDPVSGRRLRAPASKEIFLSMEQIRMLGLTRWHKP